MSRPAPRLRIELEPVTGRALPVRRGEILSIAQVEGEQCVDFGCFALDDAGIRLSVGRMRRDGFRARAGTILWSNVPDVPLMAVVSIAEHCTTDVLGPRCTAPLFERAFGLHGQPNCQDTLAEAIREYGLHPWDVHDSFNMWMDTAVDGVGWSTTRNTARPGDRIELVALRDVLAVPVVCGSGNVFLTSNYGYKRIRIDVADGADEPFAAALLASHPLPVTTTGGPSA